jgi:arabinogalactan endo-1,4-beta-galactosidase
MDQDKFMQIISDHHTYRMNILCNPKKSRTSGNTDRLIQFKRMAKMRKCSTLSACVDLCTKQFTDILDMADGSHPHAWNVDYFEELISDVQNYLDIALAIMKEEKENDLG